MINREDNLNYKSFDATLTQLESILVLDVSLEVTLIAKIKQDAKFSLILKLLFEAADVWVPNIT